VGADRLGTGDYTVMVAKRGASIPFDELEFSSLTWGRVLDDISSASVTCDPYSRSRKLLGSLREWQHELWIYRGDELVWRGPVTPTPTISEDSVTVPAKDFFAFFERRDLEYPLTLVDMDLTYIFYYVLRSATVRDPHPGLTLLPALSGIKGELTVDPAQRSKAADVLRTLARSGVDFTVIRDDLLLGAPEFPGIPMTYLTSDVVSGVTITPLPTASEVTVTGANSGAAGVPLIVTVGGIDPLIGLVTETDNESGAKTMADVALAAQSRLDFYRGEPVSASMTLDPQAPVSIAQLVPGSKPRLGIDHLARPLIGYYRLTKVDVSWSASDTGDTETVTIEVAPLGTQAP